MYQKNDFDLAGFAVGIAEKDELDRVSLVKEGDMLIALPSSGIHSNGFSLVRKLIFEKLEHSMEDMFGDRKLIDVLLEPTRIYVKTFKTLKPYINALAHITGGGIVENLPRVLPDNLKAVVKKDDIRVLPIFEYMGDFIEENEMFKTFNMGIGMILVVDPEHVQTVLKNSDGYIIGEITEGKKGVELI